MQKWTKQQIDELIRLYDATIYEKPKLVLVVNRTNKSGDENGV